MTEQHRAALARLITHAPTIAAYERNAGESIAPVLNRYTAWIRENLIGPEDMIEVDEDEAAA